MADKFPVEISVQGTWSLDYTLATIIWPAIKKFRESRGGIPSCMFPEDHWDNPKPGDNERAEKKWDTILRKIERAFKLCADPSIPIHDKNTSDEIDEGIALFAKYYHHLWW